MVYNSAGSSASSYELEKRSDTPRSCRKPEQVHAEDLWREREKSCSSRERLTCFTSDAEGRIKSRTKPQPASGISTLTGVEPVLTTRTRLPASSRARDNPSIEVEERVSLMRVFVTTPVLPRQKVWCALNRIGRCVFRTLQCCVPRAEARSAEGPCSATSNRCKLALSLCFSA